MFQWIGGHGNNCVGLGTNPCEITIGVDLGGEKPWCVGRWNNHGVVLGMSPNEATLSVDLGGSSKYSNEIFKDWNGHVA
jgi:hypothetical protein